MDAEHTLETLHAVFQLFLFHPVYEDASLFAFNVYADRFKRLLDPVDQQTLKKRAIQSL